MLYCVMHELFLNKMLKKLYKYMNRWRSYGKNLSGFFFSGTECSTDINATSQPLKQNVQYQLYFVKFRQQNIVKNVVADI